MFVLLISKMRFILVVHNTIPPLIGIEPPLTLVPAPLGVTGILFSFAILSIRDTCSVVVGSTTASGVCDQVLVPSYE
jgi:hypothetical protein